MLQRPGGEMGRFTPIAGAETALTREFGKHVFEIAEVLRVAHILYNYRVWVVVGAVRYEPVSLLLAKNRVIFEKKQREDCRKYEIGPETRHFSLFQST